MVVYIPVFSNLSLAIFSLVPSLTVTVSDPMRLSLSFDSEVNPKIHPTYIGKQWTKE